MNKPIPNMYQASDGKWYPVSSMPQGQQQNYGGYGQGGGMQYGQQQQPIYVQQGHSGGGGAGAAAGTGCLGEYGGGWATARGRSTAEAVFGARAASTLLGQSSARPRTTSPSPSSLAGMCLQSS